MDKDGFLLKLQAYKLDDTQIEAALAIAQRFDDYINQPQREASAETAWDFSRMLIQEGNNSEENYISLIRYCWFIRNTEMFVALLELVDGGEVGENLYQQIGERFGSQIQAEAFDGIGVAPYGIPTPEKPAFMHPVIEKLIQLVGQEAVIEMLATSLRDLPDEAYLPGREKFNKAGNMDAYLIQRKEAFIAQLEACQRDGRLFFSQEITHEVIELVRNDPEMGGGRREGNIIYEIKIPYMAKRYLEESDPTLRGYYYCHCPWAREAIKSKNVKLIETFCNCSGGYHKKPFEAIFGQTLKVDVLESILKGDARCRFAIHLPDKA
ncbi:MAG: DUF6144 family protein [Anaerolineaceae bacterium]|nr:DUF6144 family protein [Anaerolineaceae bacterium]